MSLGFVLMIVGFVGATAIKVPNVPKPFNMPHENRTLVVLGVPSIWDEDYRESFPEIARFQMEFVRIIHEHENVVVMADRHSMPYFDGRIAKMSQRLPYDALIEANIYDPNLHDYAPMGSKNLVKFLYRNEEYADLHAKQVDDALNAFLLENHIHVDKREAEMAISANSVIDNGMGRALVEKSVVELNAEHVPDWAVMIKLHNAFKKVVLITQPESRSQNRLDDLMTFIDDDILAISAMEDVERKRLENELFSKFREDVMLVDLPANGDTHEGSCGLYTASLVTDKYIYVPMYGSDAENWSQGFSTMPDKMSLHIIEANTRKKVIPVRVPYAFCRTGMSLRSIAWTIRGLAADQMISIPRRKFVALV